MEGKQKHGADFFSASEEGFELATTFVLTATVLGTFIVSASSTESRLELPDDMLFDDMVTDTKGHDFSNFKEVNFCFLLQFFFAGAGRHNLLEFIQKNRGTWMGWLP
jgi:hypothetical protein